MVPPDNSSPEPASSAPRPQSGPLPTAVQPAVGTLLPVLAYPRSSGGHDSPLPPALAAHPDVFKLLKALKRRWLLAFCLGLLCAGGAMVVTYMVLPPGKYTASTLLKVALQQPRLIFATSEQQSDFDTYRRTQVVHIRSRPVLNTALRNPKVAELETIKKQLDPIDWLMKRVGVDFINGSEIMRISISGDNDQDLMTLANAITDAYLTEVVNKEQNDRLRRVDQLKELLTRQESSLREKRKVLRGLAEQIGTGNPDTVSSKQKATQELLTQTKMQLTQHRSELNKLEMRLLVQKGMQKSADNITLPENVVNDAIDRDSIVRRHQDTIARLETFYEETLKVAKRGTDEPQAKKTWQKIQDEKEALAAYQKRIRPEVVKNLKKRAQEQAQAEIFSLTDQIAFGKRYIEVLEAQEKALDDGDRRLNQGFLDLEAYREEIVQAEAVARRIQAEIQTMEVELKSPPRVVALETAVVTHAHDVNKQLQTAGLAGLGAFGLILLGIAFQEFRARRLDTADDVVNGLGIKVIGSLPALPNRYRSRAAGGAAGPQDNHWQQLLMESVDATRTMLLYAAKTEGVQVVMISSAVSGEGKTSLSCHLATSLARAGRKTLLVDCDLRRPATHRLFDVPLTPGLCEILRDEATVTDAVRPTAAANLFHLPAGRCTPQAIELLAQDALPRMLNQLKPEFDFLVLDTSPVLAVNDTLLVAQHVDGVLFSLLRDVSRMPAVYAAYQRLVSVGIRPLGAVVAGVRGDGYGYSYYYGYGYGYGYNHRTAQDEAAKDAAAPAENPS
jgi:capsular exopolysaccharide synthesis family protein